jgi:hypothetical protein
MNRWQKTKLFFYLTVALGFGSWLSLQEYRSQTEDMLSCIDANGGVLSAPSSCLNYNTEFWHSVTGWLMWAAVVAGALTVVLFISWLITVGEDKNHESS